MQEHETPPRHCNAARAPGTLARRAAAWPTAKREDHPCPQPLAALLRRRAAGRPRAPGPELGGDHLGARVGGDRRSAELAGAVSAAARGDRRQPAPQRPLSAPRVGIPSAHARSIGIARGTACAGGTHTFPASGAGQGCARTAVAERRISGWGSASRATVSRVAARLSCVDGTARSACVGAARPAADHRPAAAHARSGARPAVERLRGRAEPRPELSHSEWLSRLSGRRVPHPAAFPLERQPAQAVDQEPEGLPAGYGTFARAASHRFAHGVTAASRGGRELGLRQNAPGTARRLAEPVR